ncbi:GTP-binding protein Era [Flexibacter flexilis DSM 6793]|uniref:GTPase Era n=1 Tax=Flexibacter flexilis DSM 6793 TaxID=927664 RepID=A0A1I1EB76_9BACT|nr:GTPase Era [Flexibacter flexilis]SFB82260.1 GTP-binding protein Era [Flexibacter flexilis DSM 6793]
MTDSATSSTPHKAGFVSIIGKPNVGKSTLMNSLIGERLSIITSKAQTTRHRIFGIINGDDFQIVYSDTPGVIQPKYELHKSMMSFVNTSLEDADVVLFVTDIFEKYDEDDVIRKLPRIQVPVILLVNKIDQATPEQVEEKMAYWREKIPADHILPISALHGTNTDKLLEMIMNNLPLHPPYFPKDQLTDKSERFFAAEIIREKILVQYKKEVPYSCEVVVTEFKERDDMIVIRAEIYVERATQRAILLGHKGESIKKLGITSREGMEAFFLKKVFLETHVKVEPDWRDRENKLRQFGYNLQ